MRTVSVVNAKAHFSEMLAKAEAGEEVLITRRGVPVARLAGVSPTKHPPRLDDIDAFRASLKTTQERSADLIRRMRDEAY
jgi:prevent-host-death family protein